MLETLPNVNTEIVHFMIGVLLSLLFKYVPSIQIKFSSLNGDKKRLIMGLIVLSSAIIVTFIQCRGQLACIGTWEDILNAFIDIIIANQTAFLLIPDVDFKTKKEK